MIVSRGPTYKYFDSYTIKDCDYICAMIVRLTNQDSYPYYKLTNTQRN